jgi:hypothetical protein
MLTRALTPNFGEKLLLFFDIFNFFINLLPHEHIAKNGRLTGN